MVSTAIPLKMDVPFPSVNDMNGGFYTGKNKLPLESSSAQSRVAQDHLKK